MFGAVAAAIAIGCITVIVVFEVEAISLEGWGRPPRGEMSIDKFEPYRMVSERDPITDAPVVSADDAAEEVTDKVLVLGVVINSEARAYPINMLNGPAREIINDTLGGTPIAATW